MPYSIKAFEDHFGYKSDIFTDKTKLTVSFWTKTNGTNNDQHHQQLGIWNEEVMFHTHTSYTGKGSGNNNGIVLKFNFESSTEVKFKINIHFETSAGNNDYEIFKNWDGMGEEHLKYPYTDSANWHNYTYTISLTQSKLYVDGNLYGTHTFDFEGATVYNM